MKKRLIIAGSVIGIFLVLLIIAGNYTLNLTGNTAAGSLWYATYCEEGSLNYPCNAGEGDCDGDVNSLSVEDTDGIWKPSSQCRTGWCHYNAGEAYGANPSVDVCECRIGTVWDKETKSCIDESDVSTSEPQPPAAPEVSDKPEPKKKSFWQRIKSWFS
jgi:hypothetical protein